MNGNLSCLFVTSQSQMGSSGVHARPQGSEVKGHRPSDLCGPKGKTGQGDSVV